MSYAGKRYKRSEKIHATQSRLDLNWLKVCQFILIGRKITGTCMLAVMLQNFVRISQFPDQVESVVIMEFASRKLLYCKYYSPKGSHGNK